MIQPQAQDEVEPVEAGLRQMDPGLRIRWNPMARDGRVTRWDVEGRKVIEGGYDGRWQVGKLAGDGEFQLIWTVEFDGEREGEYRAVGEWLVDFFRKWDSQNRHYLEAQETEWARHDAFVATGIEWQDESAALEGLDKMYLSMTERHTRYPGRGADFQNVNSNSSK